VQDRVFPEAERFPWGHGTFDVEVSDPWALGPSEIGWSALEMVATADGLAILYTATAGKDVRVVWRDPTDGTQSALLEIDPCPDQVGCATKLIPGDDAAWLLSLTVDGVRIARVTPQGIEQAEPLCREGLPERVIDDVAWQSIQTENAVEVVGCDLTTGEELTPSAYAPSFPLLTAYIDDSSPSMAVAGNRPATWLWRAGFGVLREDGSWDEVPLPMHLRIESLTQLTDGTLLGTVEAYSALQERWYLSIVRIHTTGELEAADPGCPIEMRSDETYRRTLLAAGDWVVMTEGNDKNGADYYVIPLEVDGLD
jgi:hypothetical protein